MGGSSRKKQKTQESPDALTLKEKGRKKWVILWFGVGAAVGICLLLFCRNEEVAEEIRDFLFEVLKAVISCLIALAVIPEVWARLQKKESSIKLALGNWLVFVLICAFAFLLTAAAGAECYVVRTKWANASSPKKPEGVKTGTAMETTEAAVGLEEVIPATGCRRNSVDFVWREDPTISRVAEYFDGTPDDAEESMKLLIREDLYGISQTGRYSEEALNSSDYGDYIAEANDWHDQYEASSKGEDNASIDTQKYALMQERIKRGDADACIHTALNLEVLGTVNEALADYAGQNKHTCMKDALDNYIFALRLAIREQDEDLCRDIIDHLVKIYEKLELAGDEAAGMMKNICRDMEDEIADIICVK